MSIIRLLLVFLVGSHACQSMAECVFAPGARIYTWRYNIDFGSLAPSETSYIIDRVALTDHELVNGSGVANRFSTILTCTSESDIVSIGPSLSFITGNLTNNSNFFLKPLSSVDIGIFLNGSNVWRYPNSSLSPITMTLGELYAMRGESFDTRKGNVSWADLVWGSTTSNITLFTYKGGIVTSGGSSPGGNLLNITVGASVVFSAIVNGFTVVTHGCTVDNDAIVELGTKFIQRLPSEGSISDTTKFALELTCDSTALSPAIKFEGAVAGVDLGKNIFLNNGSAKNIGLQLLFNNALITPNVPVSLKRISAYKKTYTFDARLYRIADDNIVESIGDLDIPINLIIDYE